MSYPNNFERGWDDAATNYASYAASSNVAYYDSNICNSCSSGTDYGFDTFCRDSKHSRVPPDLLEGENIHDFQCPVSQISNRTYPHGFDDLRRGNSTLANYNTGSHFHGVGQVPEELQTGFYLQPLSSEENIPSLNYEDLSSFPIVESSINPNVSAGVSFIPDPSLWSAQLTNGYRASDDCAPYDLDNHLENTVNRFPSLEYPSFSNINQHSSLPGLNTSQQRGYTFNSPGSDIGVNPASHLTEWETKYPIGLCSSSQYFEEVVGMPPQSVPLSDIDETFSELAPRDESEMLRDQESTMPESIKPNMKWENTFMENGKLVSPQRAGRKRGRKVVQRNYKHL